MPDTAILASMNGAAGTAGQDTWQNIDVSDVPVIRASAVPASVESFFQWSLFALVACGFLALATTGHLDTPALILTSAALVIRAVLLARRVAWEIPENYSSPLAVLYFVIFFADLLFLSRTYVAATVHLVLFATVVKLFSVKRERDYLYLAMLAFLEVLAASVLTLDSAFLIAFSLFLVFAVATFLSLELRVSFLQRKGLQPVLGAARRTVSREDLARVGTALGLAILVIATGLFFVLPRRYGGYMNSLASANPLVSGFSDSVDLGAIGEIQQSNEVVMHVTTLSAGVPIDEIHWRGVTLSHFDGQRWFNPVPDFPPKVQQSQFGQFKLAGSSEPWDPLATQFGTGTVARQFRYRVSMEPIGTDVVFLPAEAELLEARFQVIDRDFGQSIFNRDRGRGTTVYSGMSDLSRAAISASGSTGASIPWQVRERYMQLPPLDGRVYRLAQQVTRDARNDYDRAAAIERYLQTQFHYTLQLPKRTVQDPLVDFLFTRKAGHCEYFASSMAVMLRSLGIPSRIVNGFRGSEYNDITGNYIVRAKNAHSWVEAYFAGYGWVEFDPTPGVAEEGAMQASRVALYLDAAREFWREWVVNYDFVHQRQLGSLAAVQSRHWIEDAAAWVQAKYRGIIDSARKWSEWVGESESGWRSALAAVGILFLVVAAPFAREMLKRQRILRRAATLPGEAAALWYERMLKNVARHGCRKLPSQTPAEFALSIEHEPLRQGVQSFTDCYERARFGHSGDAALQLPSRYKALQELQRRS